jgi:hypothetical protein
MNILASLYQTSNVRLTRVLGFTCVYHFPPSEQGLMRTTQINTFHWHVVDSQSFPLIVPGFTDIADNGAYSASSVYTPDDVADIISYAGAVRTSQCLTRRFSAEAYLISTNSAESMFSSYVAFQPTGFSALNSSAGNRHTRAYLGHLQDVPAIHRMRRSDTMGNVRERAARRPAAHRVSRNH